MDLRGVVDGALAEDAHDRCVEIAVATSNAKNAEFVFGELVSLKGAHTHIGIAPTQF